MFVTIGFGLIGFLDDYDKVKKSSHHGVSGRVRLLAEFVVAGIGTLIITWGAGTELYIPFFQGRSSISGSSTSLRSLRDGRLRQCGEPHRRAGRACPMPVIIASLAFLLISYLVGNAIIRPTGHPFVLGAGHSRCLCSAIIGAGLAFLWFNAPPRRFMGDTGSLALGGALGAIAFRRSMRSCSESSAASFVVEAMSVIIQVFFYKRTGKRVFKMAADPPPFRAEGCPSRPSSYASGSSASCSRWPASRR
jgi:phospho-N-acetylmuramoyl-pentapeptide-transferase